MGADATTAAKPKPKTKTKPKPKKRPAPPAPAPADANRGTGWSRDFQFTEVRGVKAYFASYKDGQLVFDTSAPKKPTPIKAKWIYAFEVRSNNKTQLTKEYYCDQKGALSFVDGDKRRGVDLKAAPTPTPIATASLPLSNNGDAVHHVFVVMRARIGKNVILSMESS